MALTEKTELTRLEVKGPYKIVEWDMTTIVYRDGVEFARNIHSDTRSPGQDTTGVPEDVKKACTTFHTKDVVDAYKKIQ
jgi:hypothetical protein